MLPMRAMPWRRAGCGAAFTARATAVERETNGRIHFYTSLSNETMQHCYMYRARGPAKVGDGTRPCVEWLVLLGSRMQVVKLPGLSEGLCRRPHLLHGQPATNQPPRPSCLRAPTLRAAGGLEKSTPSILRYPPSSGTRKVRDQDEACEGRELHRWCGRVQVMLRAVAGGLL